MLLVIKDDKSASSFDSATSAAICSVQRGLSDAMNMIAKIHANLAFASRDRYISMLPQDISQDNPVLCGSIRSPHVAGPLVPERIVQTISSMKGKKAKNFRNFSRKRVLLFLPPSRILLLIFHSLLNFK